MGYLGKKMSSAVGQLRLDSPTSNLRFGDNCGFVSRKHQHPSIKITNLTRECQRSLNQTPSFGSFASFVSLLMGPLFFQFPINFASLSAD